MITKKKIVTQLRRDIPALSLSDANKTADVILGQADPAKKGAVRSRSEATPTKKCSFRDPFRHKRD